MFDFPNLFFPNIWLIYGKNPDFSEIGQFEQKKKKKKWIIFAQMGV